MAERFGFVSPDADTDGDEDKESSSSAPRPAPIRLDRLFATRDERPKIEKPPHGILAAALRAPGVEAVPRPRVARVAEQHVSAPEVADSRLAGAATAQAIEKIRQQKIEDSESDEEDDEVESVIVPDAKKQSIKSEVVKDLPPVASADIQSIGELLGVVPHEGIEEKLIEDSANEAEDEQAAVSNDDQEMVPDTIPPTSESLDDDQDDGAVVPGGTGHTGRVATPGSGSSSSGGGGGANISGATVTSPVPSGGISGGGVGIPPLAVNGFGGGGFNYGYNTAQNVPQSMSTSINQLASNEMHEHPHTHPWIWGGLLAEHLLRKRADRRLEKRVNKRIKNHSDAVDKQFQQGQKSMKEMQDSLAQKTYQIESFGAQIAQRDKTANVDSVAVANDAISNTEQVFGPSELIRRSDEYSHVEQGSVPVAAEQCLPNPVAVYEYVQAPYNDLGEGVIPQRAWNAQNSEPRVQGAPEHVGSANASSGKYMEQSITSPDFDAPHDVAQTERQQAQNVQERQTLYDVDGVTELAMDRRAEAKDLPTPKSGGSAGIPNVSSSGNYYDNGILTTDVQPVGGFEYSDSSLGASKSTDEVREFGYKQAIIAGFAGALFVITLASIAFVLLR